MKEITFENAEELYGGLSSSSVPSIPDDTESVKEWNDLVKKELWEERSQVSFLTADGSQVAHSTLGKSKDDLPQLNRLTPSATCITPSTRT